MQQQLTPARKGLAERRVGGRVFRLGDKITQIRNNYDNGIAGVFNGTVGVVTTLSTDDQSLTVRTDKTNWSTTTSTNSTNWPTPTR